MKWINFILRKSSETAPDFLAGSKNGKAVKVPFIQGGAIKLLGSKIGFNMNSLADQLITLNGGTKYVINDFLITNSSISLNTADDLELFDTIGRSGNMLAANNDGRIAKLTIPQKFINQNNGGTSISNNICETNSVYASLGTAQGVPATADIYIFGYSFP